ncbi:unnamed protein product [Ascophyllum nodosum]
MGATTEGTTEAVDYQARVVEITTLLRGRAPKLFPCNIAPRSCKPYTSILGLCSTTRQRVDAKVFIEKAKDAIAEQRRKKHEAGQGGDNGKDVDDQTMNIVVVAEIDLTARKFRVTGAKFVDNIDATLHDLERVMELLLNSSENDLEPYVRRFASANELRSDTPAASTMQEVCSLSYALQVTASNLSGWTARAGSYDLPLARDVDMTTLLRELFDEPPTPSAPLEPAGETGKRGGARSRGQKKGKPTKARMAKEAGATEGTELRADEAKGARGPSKGSKRKKRP